MSVGQPAYEYLEMFGEFIFDVFGVPAYHVGSSLENKHEWYDVDIRLLLTDEEWELWEFGKPDFIPNRKRRALQLAFTELGRKLTGLPIDFQIQHQDTANKQYSGRRSAIGCIYRAKEGDG